MGSFYKMPTWKYFDEDGSLTEFRPASIAIDLEKLYQDNIATGSKSIGSFRGKQVVNVSDTDNSITIGNQTGLGAVELKVPVPKMSLVRISEIEILFALSLTDEERPNYLAACTLRMVRVE